MSLKTWTEEFYPITASEVPKDPKTAIQHSLKKWIGLRKCNRDEHETILPGATYLTSQDDWRAVSISGSSCALCFHYGELPFENRCDSCPIVIHTGKTCDKGNFSPWRQWMDMKDPEPMINLLSNVLEKYEDS